MNYFKNKLYNIKTINKFMHIPYKKVYPILILLIKEEIKFK